jgi:hypothetical protein
VPAFDVADVVFNQAVQILNRVGSLETPSHLLEDAEPMERKEERGLNRCLEAIDLPKSTYYYRKNRPEEPSEEEASHNEKRAAQPTAVPA